MTSTDIDDFFNSEHKRLFEAIENNIINGTPSPVIERERYTLPPVGVGILTETPDGWLDPEWIDAAGIDVILPQTAKAIYNGRGGFLTVEDETIRGGHGEGSLVKSTPYFIDAETAKKVLVKGQIEILPPHNALDK